MLFLQTLQLKAGTSTVLEGVAIGLAATALIGIAVFQLHRWLPYRKMQVLTGVLVGVVLVVMIGGTALTFSELGWIPQHRGSGPPPLSFNDDGSNCCFGGSREDANGRGNECCSAVTQLASGGPFSFPAIVRTPAGNRRCLSAAACVPLSPKASSRESDAWKSAGRFQRRGAVASPVERSWVEHAITAVGRKALHARHSPEPIGEGIEPSNRRRV